MSRYNSGGNVSKVYVGDLPRDASEKDVEKVFKPFGHLKNVWVARNPPGFAFVEFEDEADAEDAVKELDGTVICGVRARVEHSSGKSRQRPWNRNGRDMGGRGGSDRRGGGGRAAPNDRCYNCDERGHFASECRKRGGDTGGRRRRSRSRSRSNKSDSRSRSRSRSRS